MDALFADNSTGSSAAALPINEIEPNRDQPRKQFDEESLAELADSIREHGVLQPLLVRPLPSGRYQLIAGERRWRASRMAGLSEVPVVVREMTDLEAMELALIENLQREDLNPIEEALGYRQLMESYGMTQEKVASSVGKSRPAVANALRLLNLPDPVLDLVRRGQVSAGHARALLALEDSGLIEENVQKVLADRITVRELEQLAKKCKRQKTSPKKKEPAFGEESFYRELELALRQELGRKVTIRHTAGEHGSIELDFLSQQDLCDIAERLSGQKISY
ncbi:ParB/RepB/Spo0J family partition protein [Provencibacterium massiliense]|uniref:ParB/RepB/Spo0J family partition protein n=1 Tax=Oscillospiraceae TaxID=216572 RepID=UPI003BFA71F6